MNNERNFATFSIVHPFLKIDFGHNMVGFRVHGHIITLCSEPINRAIKFVHIGYITQALYCRIHVASVHCDGI